MSLRDHGRRFGKFALVGISGVLVNLAVYALLFKGASLPDFLARVLAIEVAVLNNFTWNNLWTWRDRAGQRPPLPRRLLRYHGSTLLASQLVPLGVGVVALWLFKRADLGPLLTALPLPGAWSADELLRLLSHFSGITIGMLANYVLSDRWVFFSRIARLPRDAEEAQPSPAPEKGHSGAPEKTTAPDEES